MVVIRLSRRGAKKRPFYYIVVADKRAPRDGKNIDVLGFYNPMATGPETQLKLDMLRFSQWVEKGAQPSDRVAKLAKDYAKRATA